MGSDDTDDQRVDEPTDLTIENADDANRGAERMTDAAVEEVDGRIVDLLSWILDTETRAKIYVYLLANPGSTSQEVAKGTGLYPSTVREALAELHEEEKVSREKRASEGAGNNPYEYTAIQPSELVGGVVDQVQHELNTIFTLDRILDRERDGDEFQTDVEPVTITVDDASTELTDEDAGSSVSNEDDDEADEDDEAEE